MLQPAKPVLHSYEVSVGHSRVTVESTSEESAIERARQQLSLELPRLWDVIKNLEPGRFHVVVRS